MAASPIGIDRLRESNIGRVVPRDDALRALDRNYGLRFRRLFARILEPVIIGFLASPYFEASLGVCRRSAAFGDFAVVSGGGFQGHAGSLRAEMRVARTIFN